MPTSQVNNQSALVRCDFCGWYVPRTMLELDSMPVNECFKHRSWAIDYIQGLVRKGD